MFSLAALIAFYRTDAANDNPDVMEFMKTALLTIFFQKKNIGGTDLSMLKDSINGYLKINRRKGGIRAAMEEVVNGY